MVVFVWFLYLSMIYCLRYNLHIKVEIIDTLVSRTTRKIIDIIADMILLVFSAVMFYDGALLVIFNMSRAGGKTPMLDIPYYAVYIVLPLSFGLFTVFLAIRIFNMSKTFSRKK